MPKKKKQSKGAKVLNWLNPNTPAKNMLLFALIFAVIGGSYAAYKSFAATPCINQTFRQGSSGQCVKDIQAMLNGVIGTNLSVDGAFGGKTKNAVIWEQATHGLVTDGVVGPKTWGLICSHNNSGPPPAVWQLYAMNAGCHGYPQPVHN